MVPRFLTPSLFAFALVCATGWGCSVKTNFDGTNFRCGADGECPQGFRCNASDLCISEAAGPDASLLLCGDEQCTEGCGVCVDDCGACLSGQRMFWTFDGDDPTAVRDVSGEDRDGVVMNVSRVSSPRGTALEFDGTGGTATRVGDPSLEAEAVALAAWVQVPPGSGTRREIVSYGDVVALRINGDDTVRLFVRQELDWLDVDTTETASGEWQHIVGQVSVGTVGERTMEVYLDGALVASGPLPEAIAYDALPGRDLVVGEHGDGGDNPMVGAVDEVRVFGRALSADEIAGLAAPL